MINSVRQTVLSVLNKNNYGYISPSDFNLYAKQAQLEIFDGYFKELNQVINAENSRMSGTEYADFDHRELCEAVHAVPVPREKRGDAGKHGGDANREQETVESADPCGPCRRYAGELERSAPGLRCYPQPARDAAHVRGRGDVSLVLRGSPPVARSAGAARVTLTESLTVHRGAVRALCAAPQSHRSVRSR